MIADLAPVLVADVGADGEVDAVIVEHMVPVPGRHYLRGHDGRVWYLPGWRSSWTLEPERRGRGRK